jgi:hypothetical protein
LKLWLYLNFKSLYFLEIKNVPNSQTKTDIVVIVVWFVEVANGRTAVVIIVVPPAATQNTAA